MSPLFFVKTILTKIYLNNIEWEIPYEYVEGWLVILDPLESRSSSGGSKVSLVEPFICYRTVMAKFKYIPL